MLVGRSRCLSWEEEQHVLHLEVEEDAGNAPPTAEPPAAQGAAPPPPPPPPPQPRREEEVAQLQAYLAGLGSIDGKLEEPLLPGAFPALVERVLQGRRQENSALRGWVSAAATRGGDPSAAPPVATYAPTLLSLATGASGTVEPKLEAALLKVQQLDGALAAADQRAAAVAAGGRELQQQREGSGDEGAGGGGSNSGGGGGGLAEAMARERCRLQHEVQLLQALQDCQLGDTTAAATAEDSIGSGSAGELRQEEEALLQALLGQAEGAPSPPNPYALGCSEMIAIDEQLAALCSVENSGVLPDALGNAAAGPPLQQRADGEQEEVEEVDLEAVRSSYQRAQGDARAMAQHLRSIDGALRALRTDVPAPLAAS